MKRKALGVLIQEYVKDSYEKWDKSKDEFGKVFGIQPTTLSKILYTSNPEFHTRVIDRILEVREIDLQYLIDTYGEYERE